MPQIIAPILGKATISLIRKGHSRVIYIAVDKHLRIPSLRDHDEIVNYFAEERVRGYEMAMREAGLAKYIHVLHAPGRLWTERDRAELFGTIRDYETTACCCFNDDIAARVYHMIHERGLSIPEDLSVIGNDDAGLARRHSTWVDHHPFSAPVACATCDTTLGPSH